MVEKYLRGAVLDSSGEYAVTRDIITGDSVPITFDVTLVTQCDVHALLDV